MLKDVPRAITIHSDLINWLELLNTIDVDQIPQTQEELDDMKIATMLDIIDVSEALLATATTNEIVRNM